MVSEVTVVYTTVVAVTVTTSPFALVLVEVTVAWVVVTTVVGVAELAGVSAALVARTAVLAEATGAVEFDPVVELEDEVVRAAIFDAAISATTATMAWVFPVGRSGWIEASTMNKLSVP